MALWEEFRPIRRVTRIVIAVYVILTVGIPATLARVQYLKATADRLTPSASFAGTVTVFSAALLGFTAIGALLIYFYRENQKQPDGVAHPLAAAPVPGSDGWDRLVKKMERDHEEKVRGLNESWKEVVDALKVHNATSAGRIGNLTKELESLRPGSEVLRKREEAVTKREDDAKKIEDAINYNLHHSKSVLDGKDAQIAALEKKVTGYRTLLSEAERNSRRNYQLFAYGRELKTLPALEPHTHEAVRLSLAGLAPLLNEMYQEAQVMWQLVGAEAQAKGDSPLSLLHVYMRSEEYYHMHRAAQLFWELLSTKEDLRPCLSLVCINYFEWRKAILRLARETGVSADQRENYEKWRSAENAYLTDLRTKVAPEEVDSIRKDIGEYFGNQGVLIKVDLPTKQLALPPSKRSTAGQASPSTES